jgi:opacity protein-like surface antigen
MRSFLGIASLVLGGLVIASAAAAQESGWAGYYAGAGLSDVGGRNGDIEASIDPARDSRLNYFTSPASRSFSRERNLDRESTFNLKAGRLFENGRVVWGVEGEIRTGGPDRIFVVGPVSSEAAINARDLSLIGNNRPAGGLATTTDTLVADFETQEQASLRLRVGLPVSERFLISAFAGPSVMQTDLTLRQDSVVEGFVQFTDALGSRLVVRPFPTGSYSVSGSNGETLFGGVIGASVDARLTDRWLLNGEASLTRYDAIEAMTPAYAGSGSRFSYEPTLYSVSLSLIRRF